MRLSGNPVLLAALAATVKARRNELDISQEEAAGRSELDRPYWTLIEAGRKQPTLSVMYRIAFALEFSLAELAYETETRYAALKGVSRIQKSAGTAKPKK
jgi:transcriptional regulator with XRE-family HTH domain